MKKMLALIAAAIFAVMLCPVSLAEGFGSFGSFGSFDSFGSIEMPEMPEMPTFDTSSWGDFAPPEGWGDMDLGSFSSPINGEGWGDLGGTNADWGSSFEEMKKNMESGFNSNKEQNGASSDWPPSSFKDLENAFNEQRSGIGNTGTGDQTDVKDLFSSKFGDIGSDFGTNEMPSLDFAQNALTENQQELQTPTGKYLSVDSSNIANINTIQSFISNTSGKINENVSFDSLDAMPSLGVEIGNVDMRSSYSDLASALSPKFNYTKKYNGSLFEKAK